MNWHCFLTGAQYGGYDKVVHFIASAAIAAVLLTVAPVWLAACLSIIVGIYKELFDWRVQKSRVSASDLLADSLGVTFVVIVYYLVANRF